MALAYTALTFVTVTLLIGPWYVLRHRATPMIHNALRRDIGIWTGILGLSHMLVGTLIHTNGWKMLQRLNYVALALIATYGILYQTIEQRDVMLIYLFRGVILSIFVVQLMGVLFVLFCRMQLRRHRQFFEKS
jgi:DMSO/TMAO reductase YedYZ heme-binding membrane subunit